MLVRSELLLEVHVDAHGPRDLADRSGPESPLVHRLLGCCHEARVVREAEVVVGGERDHFLAVHGHAVGLLGVEDGELAEEVLGLEVIDHLLQPGEAVGFHWDSLSAGA